MEFFYVYDRNRKKLIDYFVLALDFIYFFFLAKQGGGGGREALKKIHSADHGRSDFITTW